MPTQDITEEKQGTEKEKMVSVPESVLSALTSRLERLERGDVLTIDETEQNQKATMRTWDKKLVVGWETPYIVKDSTKTGEEKMMFTVKLKNKDSVEQATVNYLEFLRNAERVDVEILRMEKKEMVTLQGYSKYVQDERGFEYAPSVKVPIRIVTPTYTATVKLPTGHEVTIDANYLNA